LILVSSLLQLCVAEPPNLLFHGAQLRREMEMSTKDQSSVWEQAIFDKDHFMDARQIIDGLGQNSHLLPAECAQDIDLLIKAILEFEEGALSGNVTLTDFDRNVLLPMLDSAGRIGPGILRVHIY
ncbi:hypothetical protein PENTCL1PPCAC_14341, partial [Pristionchus entomophagus]